MNPKNDGGGAWLAPGASTSASTYVLPGRERSASQTPVPGGFPRVDERLVEAEVSREIVIRGERMVVQGADEEHGDTHACIDFVLLPHVRQECTTSTDLLTRASQASDFATDASVRKAGKDPSTGSRYLEELSFEVVNEQSMGRARRKVEDLAHRGVRRIFAIFVKKGEVREWSKTKQEFVTLDLDGVIEDPALIRPISVRSLLDRTQAEIDVAKVLIKKNNPEIAKLSEKAHKDGLDEGDVRGRRAVLCELLEDQFGELPAALCARIEAADVEQVRTWTKKLRSATSMADVFAEREARDH